MTSSLVHCRRMAPYGSNLVALGVADGAAIPANTRGLLLAGSDGTTARRLAVNASGELSVDPSSGSLALVAEAGRPTFSVLHQGRVSSSTPVNMGFVQVAAGSSFKACVQEIWLRNVTTASGGAVIVRFELRRVATSISQTPSTPVAMDSSDSLDSTITTGYGGGSFGGTSILNRYCWMAPVIPSTINEVTFEHAVQNAIPAYKVRSPRAKPITVRPGEVFAVMCIEGSALNNITMDVELVFTQETT